MHEGRKTVSKATGLEMEIAVIGLGRMGANIARRLARGGHRVFVYDRSPEKAPALAREKPADQGSLHTGWTGEVPLEAAVPVGHGSRRQGNGCCYPGSFEGPLARRRDHRRGQLELPGIHGAGKSARQTGNPFCRCRHQRRNPRPEGGLQPDGWRRKDRRGSPATRFRDTCTLAETRLGTRGAGRLRPFRQDGPQRHRVRPHAGLRRGLRDSQGPEGLRPRPAPGRRDLALRERRPLLAPRPHRREPRRKIGN